MLKCFSDVQRMDESQQLSMCLGTHNCILTSVKNAIQRVTGFQDVLCEIVNVCVHTYENYLYMTPAEKHSIVKVSHRTMCCCVLFVIGKLYGSITRYLVIAVSRITKIDFDVGKL